MFGIVFAIGRRQNLQHFVSYVMRKMNLSINIICTFRQFKIIYMRFLRCMNLARCMNILLFLTAVILYEILLNCKNLLYIFSFL